MFSYDDFKISRKEIISCLKLISNSREPDTVLSIGFMFN